MTHVAALRHLLSIRSACVLVLALCVASCDDGSGPGPNVARVEVNLASPTLLIGTNASAIARAFDFSGNEVTGARATWKSSKTDVVSVDGNGVLTGKALGSATITAIIGGVSGTAPITIVPLPVASITILPGGGPIDRGQSLQLRAVILDQFGEPILDRIVEWKSSFPGIAQVTSSGFVSAIAAGTTEITASSEGQSATVTISVVVTQVPSGPNISSITPSVLTPGTTATIRGTNFGSVIGENDVRVAGVPAAVLAASTTELTVQLGTTGYGCEPTRQVYVQVLRGSVADANLHHLQSVPQRNLAVGESVVLTELAEAQCFELAATGGRYAISIFNSATDVQTGSEVSFRVRGARGVIPPGVAAAPPADASPARQTMAFAPVVSSAGLRMLLDQNRRRSQEEAHARVLDFNLRRLAQGRSHLTRGPLAGAQALAAVTATQAVGSIVSMRIPNLSTGDVCDNFLTVSARVAYNGTRAIILEDVNAPFQTQMDTIFQKIGREFDDVMFDVVRTTFGDPLRMDDLLDNNGKIIMLFSPRINQFAGIVAFVASCDFESQQTSPSSNRAEVFYAGVPTDPRPDTTIDQTRAGFYRTIRATIVHEVKHIASFATRTRDFGNTSEQRWIEEGSARIAEEVWGRTAAYTGMLQKSNAIYASTLFCDLRPSNPSAPQCNGKPFVMFRHFRDYFPFMRDPEAHSVLGPRSGLPDISWYGTSWSMLRWAADHWGNDEAAFFQALIHSSLAGVANLTSRTGRTWEEMMGEWSLSQFVDDVPGFAPTNARLTFPSWNLRSIFAGMNADNPASYSPAFPLVPRSITYGNFTITVPIVLGGGFSMVELSGTQTGRQLIQLQGFTGGDPPGRLRVAIVRMN